MGFAAGQSVFANALLDPAVPLPGNVVSARGAGDPVRFAVYRNNVFVGLTSALAKRFPVTERLVGNDFFTGMARVYAGIEKPRTPLMFQYGDGFPDFIATFGPAASLPYLADVARVEAAWTRAYHAADVATASVADLAGVDPAGLSVMRLAKHPAAAVVTSRHPVGSIWHAHQRAELAPLLTARRETVLVTRPDAHVLVHILPEMDGDFATALMAGVALGEAAETATVGDPSFDFGAALIGLLSLGAFAAPIP